MSLVNLVKLFSSKLLMSISPSSFFNTKLAASMNLASSPFKPLLPYQSNPSLV